MNITTPAQAGTARDRIMHCLKMYLCDRGYPWTDSWYMYAKEGRDLTFALYQYTRCHTTWNRYRIWADLADGRRDRSIDLETALAEYVKG